MEPAFEILKDGTYVCVTRTTDGEGNCPMYISYSKDSGKNWSKIEAIGTNGVSPRLLQLANGVVVLASGRSGVQLRFLVNRKDRTWTRPFEMVPYENEKDDVSCGYSNLIANDATQASRAWQQDGKIDWLIADYCNNGSEPFYRTPHSDDRIKITNNTLKGKMVMMIR